MLFVLHSGERDHIRLHASDTAFGLVLCFGRNVLEAQCYGHIDSDGSSSNEIAGAGPQSQRGGSIL